MNKFDIPVNITVLAKDEADAEQLVLHHLKAASLVVDNPDILDYELIVYIPEELTQSCCC